MQKPPHSIESQTNVLKRNLSDYENLQNQHHRQKHQQNNDPLNVQNSNKPSSNNKTTHEKVRKFSEMLGKKWSHMKRLHSEHPQKLSSVPQNVPKSNDLSCALNTMKTAMKHCMTVLPSLSISMERKNNLSLHKARGRTASKAYSFIVPLR